MSDSKDSKKETINMLSDVISAIPNMSCVEDEPEFFYPDNTNYSANEINVRCICNSKHVNDVLIQCDSCKNYLHLNCLQLENQNDVKSFVCIYCQHNVTTTVRSFLLNQSDKLNSMIDNFLEMPDNAYSSAKHEIAPFMDMIKEIEGTLKKIPEFLPPQGVPYNQSSDDNSGYEEDKAEYNEEEEEQQQSNNPKGKTSSKNAQKQ